jgi:hypothetical protein
VQRRSGNGLRLSEHTQVHTRSAVNEPTCRQACAPSPSARRSARRFTSRRHPQDCLAPGGHKAIAQPKYCHMPIFSLPTPPSPRASAPCCPALRGPPRRSRNVDGKEAAKQSKAPQADTTAGSNRGTGRNVSEVTDRGQSAFAAADRRHNGSKGAPRRAQWPLEHRVGIGGHAIRQEQRRTKAGRHAQSTPVCLLCALRSATSSQPQHGQRSAAVRYEGAGRGEHLREPAAATVLHAGGVSWPLAGDPPVCCGCCASRRHRKPPPGRKPAALEGSSSLRNQTQARYNR